MPHSLVSVHPSVLAALLEDAKAGETEASDAPPAAAVAAWLVGLSLRDRENGNVSTTRVVGVVRCSCPPRPLAEDLAATTAMLPGGVSVVGAVAAFAPSSPPPQRQQQQQQQSLRSLACAAAAAARGAGGASAAEVAVAVDGEGTVLWLVGRGEEERDVVVVDDDDDATASSTSTATAAAAPATPRASRAVAALSTPRSLDPWILANFSAVRCGPLKVNGGTEGARAALAELCGDGDDPGDAAFVVSAEEASNSSSSSSSSPPSSSSGAPFLLAGDGPAPQGSAASPLLVAPHSSPPPPPPPRQRSRLSSDNTVGPPPAPTAVFDPLPRTQKKQKSKLILDAVAFYPKTATAGEAAAALRVALSRQLRAAMTMAAAATTSTTTTAATKDTPSFPLSLRASPFLLPGLPVFVTPLLPFAERPRRKAKKNDNSKANSCSSSSSTAAAASAAAAAVVGARASLGRALRVPAGLPLLRPSAAALSASPKKKKKNMDKENKKKGVDSRSKLLDVHLGLPCYSPSAPSSSSSTSKKAPPPSSSSSPPILSFTPPLPPTPTLSCATVAGSYRYFHYGQDGCDDKGWGCAYRSLQTLWSWFAENHFFGNEDDDDVGVGSGNGNGNENNDGGGKTENKNKKLSPPFDPPSHAEVQRTLVSLGDKPPSFLGSNSWIGAMEISYVLDSLAGIECKVVTVPSGKALATSTSAAAALVSHFRSQGTPCMIGGGVLAYTCLGAAYDCETGEASYLILDPHYCGVSDSRNEGRGGGSGGGGEKNSAAAAAAAAAANVIKGGWVAWKKPGDNAAAGGPLFVDDAFYNILLPQRPKDAV